MAKPKGHVKPTKEELEAQEKAALEEAEKLKDNPPEEDPPEATPSEPAPSEPEPSEPPPPEPDADPSEAVPSKELYKKKFSDSSRENQKIYAKNRVISKALADAEDVPDPTEEELATEFSDWDMMSETERTFAREAVISRRWRQTISEAKEQATKIEKWNESVETFVDDPKTLVDNPELEGKTDKFKEFATEETNNSVPFNILISAFLHEHSSSKSPNKGRMFEKGSGGPNDKPKPKDGKITLEEARKLRETDYNKYREFLTSGKIEQNV
ncbi:hypothetical protein CMO96_05075 [Candidatus Woesebacteria bacterium]|nr:hypothetical protein [Candidatus Woesebacteria bacterium]